MVAVRNISPLASFVVLGAAFCLIGFAPLGWHLGWWPYSVGLYRMIPAAGVAAAAAVMVALRTLASSWSYLRPGTIALLVMVAMAGASVAYVPLRFAYARATLPAIHDISTDT